MKKILVTLGLICLTVLSAQANIRISFKGRCPTFADSIKNCCGSIITDSEGNLTCTEMCDSGEVCTPAGCCENGTDVYRNASGAYQCCKGTVCKANCCESGQECIEGICCQTGQVLCNGECQDKPTVNENNCEKLSEDECSVISKCTDGQECDGAGNCVEAVVCKDGEKICGTDEKWCCEEEKECGSSVGLCCDGRGCCKKGEAYIDVGNGMICCPKKQACEHNCCSEGKYCADPIMGVCCDEGQVVCNGNCQDKPVPNTDNCEKLSEDECHVVQKCSFLGQSCDGSGSCTGWTPADDTCDSGNPDASSECMICYIRYSLSLCEYDKDWKNCYVSGYPEQDCNYVLSIRGTYLPTGKEQEWGMADASISCTEFRHTCENLQNSLSEAYFILR